MSRRIAAAFALLAAAAAGGGGRAPYRAAWDTAAGADPRVAAYLRERVGPLIALARRDRREARIAIARRGALDRGEELRAEFAGQAEAKAAAAGDARERASSLTDDLRLALAGGAAVLVVLALLCGILLARAANRRLRAGTLAAERLRLHLDIARAIGAGADPDELLRELADALSAELGALYLRAGEGPLRLAAVRGLDGRQIGDELRPGEGLAGRAAAELRPVAASYDEAALVVRAHGRDVPVRHELHLPLSRGGFAFGVLTLARIGGEAFGEGERELAEAAVPMVVASLEPAQAPQAQPPRQVDLVRLMRESVEAARPEAEERGIEVSLDLESVPRCGGDPDRISLALDEVVARAMAAAGAGGKVSARLFPRAGLAVAELTVSPGNGGGLDFARSVFEDHGGAVLVEGPGGGATAFRVEIPLRATEHA